DDESGGVHLERDARLTVGVEQLERPRVQRKQRTNAGVEAFLAAAPPEAPQPADERRIETRPQHERLAAGDELPQTLAHHPGSGERVGQTWTDPARVSAGRTAADRAALEDDDVGSGPSQLPGAGESDDAGADDGDPRRRQSVQLGYFLSLFSTLPPRIGCSVRSGEYRLAGTVRPSFSAIARTWCGAPPQQTPM